MGNADAMSRLPLDKPSKIRGSTLNFVSVTGDIPINSNDVIHETSVVSSLRKIIEWLKNGDWPKTFQTSLEQHLYNRKDELCFNKGCLFLGKRLIIPETLKRQVLNMIHDCHAGVVRMKSVARGMIWWLNIDRDIEFHSKSWKKNGLKQHFHLREYM